MLSRRPSLRNVSRECLLSLHNGETCEEFLVAA